MKTKITQLVLCACLMISTNLYSQDAKYVNIMEKVLTALDTAQQTTTLQDVANTFQRIANANSSEWLPLYYQSYCTVMLGMRETDNLKKDEMYDNAQALADKADKKSPDNSEIYVLKAFITSMKLSVDPMTRGRSLGMESYTLTSKAIELDPTNPRPYLLRGSGLMYTPEQFGGGKDKALPVLEEALAKYKTFKPSSSIMPKWGEERTQQLVNQIKSEKK